MKADSEYWEEIAARPERAKTLSSKMTGLGSEPLCPNIQMPLYCSNVGSANRHVTWYTIKREKERQSF
ncbi:hypothetical protein L6164_010887 [Bauhinia variegata]|uniref:Uncharacterized protein n=1 Tax=Bauhinia variegata TaxID=167791 RepID=A0ACB9P578_BAUVA|nr:hypothetical protein L6164_010887 [Bauhinia variegata]